ncbi:hypothetical protein Val02_79060 [Virgisporangium aliadipatigenens]|uniref:Serine/threonine protein kinase n=1 Tax=Virgisporangium aliadipatigenens TaxID=741659 RepID=A0A8J3YWD6_9ACTN|nr:hypothetical protein Val02_79060 [Virgisporangium aliadipatigenens]
MTIAAGALVAATVLGLSITAANRDAERAARNTAAAAAAESPAVPPSPSAQPSPSAPTVPDRPPTTYAGSIAGLGASIAVAVNGRSAVGYVCDGKRVEAWYQGGTTDGTAFTLAGNADGATLSAKLGQGALAGTVRIAGRDLTFTAQPVQAPNGLFRAVEQAAATQAATVVGWIVTPDGQVGIQRRGDEVAPAPVLDPASGTATLDGRAIKAVPVTGAPL